MPTTNVQPKPTADLKKRFSAKSYRRWSSRAALSSSKLKNKNGLTRVPDDTNSTRRASANAGCLLSFRFTGSAGILDFFAVLLSDGGDCFVLKIDKLRG